jgi:DNA-binding response OmpR family regulator
MSMKKIRIVAIDDVADILDLIEYNLNKEGMDVRTFTDSAEGVDFINKTLPDIVVSDWMMPEPNGLQVCSALKSNDLTKNIPIIMLTCKGSLTDYKEAMDAGASDYVVKPVRMEELVRRIKLVLPFNFNRVKFG